MLHLMKRHFFSISFTCYSYRKDENNNVDNLHEHIDDDLGNVVDDLEYYHSPAPLCTLETCRIQAGDK